MLTVSTHPDRYQYTGGEKINNHVMYIYKSLQFQINPIQHGRHGQVTLKAPVLHTLSLRLVGLTLKPKSNAEL